MNSLDNSIASEGKALLRRLPSLSGSQVMRRIIDSPVPEKLVQALSPVDFFWIVKKVGEDESVALLRLASQEQWQYILDMDLWNKDRLNLVSVSEWL